jgi:uncharacterized protein (TIGR00299 family) protein
VRVIHFDCFSGASGDMILGALIDAGADHDAIRAGLDSLGLPIRLTIERVKRCGIAATHARVEAPEEHVHRHLHHVEAIIDKGGLTERQRSLANAFFRRLAEAEATVHGIPVEKVHFHEVGALDSIADFVGAAIGLDLLGVERMTSRSVPPGSGTIKCEHGLMPVPAPATALLLRGVPLAASSVTTELTTPTGAAILTATVDEWTDSPSMTVERIGHGAGTKDFPGQPNVLRILVGTFVNPAEADTVWQLETNLDDVPGEIIGYTIERLFEAGALDVWTTPLQMKKNRPGVLLGLLTPADVVSECTAILMRETGTFGVRRYAVQRSKLRRRTCLVETPWGPVKAKRGEHEGITIVAPEFEDCARIARERGIALRDVYRAVQSGAVIKD